MVFSPVPLYLDPPHYQQQLNAHRQLQAGGNSNHTTVVESFEHQLTPPAMPPPADMLARVPPHDQTGPPVKCPRCGSGNTKFCYYNNYSLSQPRHFCKNCRRYWTVGGILRNVPIGGGSKAHNKTTKSRRTNKRQSPHQRDHQMMMMMPSLPRHHNEQFYHHNFMHQPNDLLHLGRSFGAVDVGPSQAPAAAAGGGENFALTYEPAGIIDDESSSTNDYKFDQGLFERMINNFHY